MSVDTLCGQETFQADQADYFKSSRAAQTKAKETGQMTLRRPLLSTGYSHRQANRETGAWRKRGVFAEWCEGKNMEAIAKL